MLRQRKAVGRKLFTARKQVRRVRGIARLQRNEGPHRLFRWHLDGCVLDRVFSPSQAEQRGDLGGVDMQPGVKVVQRLLPFFVDRGSGWHGTPKAQTRLVQAGRIF